MPGEGLLDRIDAAIELLLELRAEAARKGPQEPTDEGTDDFAPELMIDTVAAAERFHRPRDCMTRWAREGAGQKIGGRWLISVVRAQRRLRAE